VNPSDYKPFDYKRVLNFSNTLDKSKHNLSNKYEILDRDEFSQVDPAQKEKGKEIPSAIRRHFR